MTPGEQLRRVRLFVISYGPLWLMLAFRAMPEGAEWRWSAPNTGVSALLAVGAVWSFVDAWRLVRGAQRKAAIRMRFTELRDEVQRLLATSPHISFLCLPTRRLVSGLGLHTGCTSGWR